MQVAVVRVKAMQRVSRFPQLLKDVSVSAAGEYVAAGSSMLRGLILAKLLVPEGVGTLATIALILAYSLYADLGIVLAVARALPLAIGGGKEEEAQTLPSYAFVASIAGGSLVAVGVCTFLILGASGLPPDVRFGLAVAGFSVILQAVVSAQQILLRAMQEYRKAALLVASTAVINCVAGVAGAYLFGVRGALVGQLLALAITAYIGFLIGRFPRLRSLERSRVVRLLRLGLPLAVLLFGVNGLVHIDSLMVLIFEGRKALGVYAVVLYLGAALFLLPAAVNHAMVPRVLRRYGEHETLVSIEALTWRPVLVLSSALPVAIVAASIAGPFLIDSFLPLYREAIGPMRLYLVAGFFLGINAGTGGALMALNKYRRNIPIVLGAIAFNAAIDAVLLGHFGLGLMGVALGSVITYFLYWLAVSGMVRWLFDPHLLRVLRFNLKMAWPGLVLASFALYAWRIDIIDRSTPLLELPLFFVTGISMWLRWRQLNSALWGEEVRLGE